MTKYSFLLFNFFLFTTSLQAQINDSIDVLHYNIQLDIRDIQGQKIHGYCDLDIKALYQIRYVDLMLKTLEIDSVVLDQEQLAYTRNMDDIKIDPARIINTGEIIRIRIYYGGKADKDPVWGGFFFSNKDGGYAYNMGIGMGDYPNAYGRVWFPCKDNFTDRATYEFHIRTEKDKSAFCSGILSDTIIQSDGSIIWAWSLDQPLSTDLGSVAVGPYAFLNMKHQGTERDYDILFGVRPEDSNDLKSSFIHIHEGLEIFEKLYGPYPFDRVGFVVVPFGSGAMEHAANIAYPGYAIDGTLDQERLWVHELAHSWWGNMVKCRVSPEMWLNEGWAVYSEKLFAENMYGREAYQEAIQQNHQYVMQYAHIDDGAPIALFPLSHENTYSTHAYKKGADIVHTLRSYMGDSLFFISIKKYLKSMAWDNSTTLQLRDSLSSYSGLDLKDFFSDWVMQKGSPHFSIEHVSWKQQGQKFDVDITIRQKLRFAEQYFTGVPLTITCIGQNAERKDININMSGEKENYHISLDFAPIITALDMENRISDARSTSYQSISSTGIYHFNEALMDIEVKNIRDSAFLFLEHHWVGPDNFLNNTKEIRFSDYRYWSVHLVEPDIFEAEATIRYNGKTGYLRDGSNYLDHSLNIGHEDSLVLLYRRNALSPWELYPDYVLITGNHKTDTKGEILIQKLRAGDYCLGKRDISVGFVPAHTNESHLEIIPNPAIQSVWVRSKKPIRNIRILDMSGHKLIEEKNINRSEILMDVSFLSRGTYLVYLKFQDSSTLTKKLIMHE